MPGLVRFCIELKLDVIIPSGTNIEDSASESFLSFLCIVCGNQNLDGYEEIQMIPDIGNFVFVLRPGILQIAPALDAADGAIFLGRNIEDMDGDGQRVVT